MKIGLVMAGAMAKGAYELGALKAINEYFGPDQIKYISGTSVGTLIAYAYSSGMLDESFQIWKDINKQYPKLFVRTVMTSDYFQDVINRVASREAAAEKFYVSLLNLNKRTNCYRNLIGQPFELRRDYLRASMAFVPLVMPVQVDGNYFIDGAFADNIPVLPLIEHKLDYVICVHFDKYNYTFEAPDFDNKVIKIVFNDDTELISKSIFATREGNDQMIEDGYKKAKLVLDYVFSGGVEDKQAVYDKIEFLNSFKPKKEMRLTGDIAINNIAKVTRMLTKSKIIE